MSDTSRRRLLKSIAAGSGAIVAGKSLPESWSKPVIDSVMLPAHAQTSNLVYYGILPTAGSIGSDTMLAESGRRIFTTLIPDANAQTVPIPTDHLCITVNGNTFDGRFVRDYNPSVINEYGNTGGTLGSDLLLPLTAGCSNAISPTLNASNPSSTIDYKLNYGVGGSIEGTLSLADCMAPAANCALSDIRLKTNIEALSISREGYNLYKFQYIDDNNENTYVGVMAQDVISRNPEAVIQNESGFYMVRYDQLGLKMVTLNQWESEGPDSVELLH